MGVHINHWSTPAIAFTMTFWLISNVIPLVPRLISAREEIEWRKLNVVAAFTTLNDVVKRMPEKIVIQLYRIFNRWEKMAHPMSACDGKLQIN